MLSVGNIFIPPPCIHPDTHEKYFWEGSSIFEYSIFDLEEMNIDHVREACVHIGGFKLTANKRSGGGIGSVGRNNKLTEACFAIILQNKSMDENWVAEKLLAFDLEYHQKPYFEDPKEMYFRKAATPYGRALKFVQGSYKRIKQKGML